MQRDLIFDIGMHRGDDTRFYLQKGFRVVALEANGALLAGPRAEFKKELTSRQLVIVERALAERSNETISFFVNPVKDDWSSTTRGVAEKGLHVALERQVQTITLDDMLSEFGAPYFIKCDIEGSDAVLVRQLAQAAGQPAFVSIEASSNSDLARLHAAGYDRFQIVNQQYIGFTSPPNPAREGAFADVQFTPHMSGLFGRELPMERWFDFDETAERFAMWARLRTKDEMLAPGWLDFHATTRAALEGDT